MVAAWCIVDPVIGGDGEIHSYKPGSWGPGAAETMIDNGKWYVPEQTQSGLFYTGGQIYVQSGGHHRRPRYGIIKGDIE